MGRKVLTVVATIAAVALVAWPAIAEAGTERSGTPRSSGSPDGARTADALGDNTPTGERLIGHLLGEVPVPLSPASAVAPKMKIDWGSRASVRLAYQQWYKPALAVPVGWDGKLSTCRAGNPSTAGQNATLDMVNYFREMAQLEPARFDPALSAKAQHAALIMEANNNLSHTPPSSWTCWSETGYDGASHSNIALGATGADAVDLYMRDPGSNNHRVGHRRWVTSPGVTTMGSGSTDWANALWVIGTPDPAAHVPEMIAWPTPGYFPAPLDPDGRWSLSLPAVTPENPFANARVTVRDNTGKALRTDIIDNDSSSGYGSVNALVWEVQGTGVEPKHMDRTFRVTVEGIEHPMFPSTYTYWVTAFDPETTSPPKSDPVPPRSVYGMVDGITVKGRKVRFYGRASEYGRQPTVVISRNGKTLGSVVASRPKRDGYKGWLYEPTVAPGTHTFCAHFPNSLAPSGFLVDCRQVVVK